MSHLLTAGIFPNKTLAGGFRAEAWWLTIDRTPLHNYSRQPSFYRHFYLPYGLYNYLYNCWASSGIGVFFSENNVKWQIFETFHDSFILLLSRRQWYVTNRTVTLIVFSEAKPKSKLIVEFYLYPTVGTVLIHSSQTRIDWVGRYRIRWTFKLSCVWH